MCVSAEGVWRDWEVRSWPPEVNPKSSPQRNVIRNTYAHTHTHTHTHTHVAWRGVQTVLAVFLASSSVARTKKAFHIPGLASPPPIFFSPPVVSFSCFPFSPSPHRLLFSSSSVSRSCSFSLTSLHPSILSYPSPPSLEANSSNSTSIKRRLSPIPPSGYNFLAFAPSSLWPCRPG